LPDIRKDDLANHQDKLRKGAGGAKLRAVAPEKATATQASHFKLASGNSLRGGRHAFGTMLLSLRQRRGEDHLVAKSGT
jgi:hypothetical protein